MMNALRTALIFLSMCSMAQLASAQTNNVLKLDKNGTIIEIPIEGAVNLSSDGSVSVSTSDPTACQATNSCEGVEVAVTSFSSPSAVSGTITVSEGGSFSLDWRSSGATSCAGRGTYPAWQAATTLPRDGRDASSAQKSYTTSSGQAQNSPYTLELVCKNGTIESSVTGTSRLSLVVNEVVPPSPTSCEGREPISGWTPITRCVLTDPSADCRTWPGIWTSDFLNSDGLSKKILTNVSNVRQYVAIRFDTNGMSSSAVGRLDFESAGGVVTDTAVRITISKCPGDFNAQQPTGCFFSGIARGNNLRWKGPQSLSTASCVLEPNTAYYLNILSTTSGSSTPPSSLEPDQRCTSDCGLLITP